jgi:toxin ParE1/3/4
MGQRYRRKITERAWADLEGIFTYISQSSAQNAAGVIEQILDAVDGLEQMPARFRVAGKSRRLGSSIHARTVRPFVVYYKVDETDKVVFILTIQHGARRQPRAFD